MAQITIKLVKSLIAKQFQQWNKLSIEY